MREDDLKTNKKKYIELQYSPVTQGYLREYCKDNGFDLTTRFNGRTQSEEAFDFHTTIWYTTTSHDINNRSYDVIVEDIVPKGFDIFGEGILVLEIESEQIRNIRGEFGQTHGMEDEWPVYRPHISLSYAWTGAVPEVDMPDGDEIVGGIVHIKDQKN